MSINLALSRLLLRLTLSVAIAVSVTTIVQAAEGPLRVSYLTWVGYGPLFIAQDQGYYAEEGVDVELIAMSDAKFEFAVLAAGHTDVALPTLDVAMRLIAEGRDYRILFTTDESLGADGIIATDEITSVKDLVGRSVAYSETTIAELFLKKALDDVGLSIADITSVNMTAGDAGSALIAGRVDAAVTWEPWVSQADDRDGIHVLTDSRDWPGLIATTAIADAETVVRRRTDLQAFYRAWLRALAFVDEHETEANRIMAAGVGGWLADADEFGAVRAKIRFNGAEENQAFIGTAAAPGDIVGVMEDAVRLSNLAIEADVSTYVAFEIINQ